MSGVGIRQRGVIPNRPMEPDRTHPLTEGLVFFQFAGNDRGRVGGTGVQHGSTAYGKGITTTDGNSAWAVPVRNRWGSMHNWTMFTIARVVTGALYSALFECPNSPQSGAWSSPYHAFSHARDTSTSNTQVGTNVGGTFTFSAAGTSMFVEDDLVHSYAASWGTQQSVFYRDGVQFATGGTTPNGTSPTDPATVGTPEVVFNGRSASATGEGFVGDGICQALWARRLSAKEISDLHIDPFEMFRDGR